MIYGGLSENVRNPPRSEPKTDAERKITEEEEKEKEKNKDKKVEPKPKEPEEPIKPGN
jgi:hypothetical protein